MAFENEKQIKREVFDAKAANTLVNDLRETFRSGKTKSYEWRISQLKNLMKMTDDHEDDIVNALRSDLSKPEFEAFVTEVAIIKLSINFALKGLKKWMMPEKISSSITTFPSSQELVPEPLGVVLVISPWNYPFILSIDPVIGAIAAGNTVVLKPSEITPATSSLLAKLVPEYMDNSAIKVMEGAVREISVLLEQKWDKIFYTGNGKVGRIVLAAAAKHLTPVSLELGGKCPVFVDSDTDMEVTARRIVAGKWGLNNGQTCVSADHIITTREFAPNLIAALKTELENFYGNDLLNAVDLSHIVSSHHFARLEKLLDDEKASGKIVFGGQRDQKNLQIAPTILLDAPEDSLIMNEEIFGPLLPIVTVGSLEDSFHTINAREKPLAAYLFTNDKKLKEEFVKNVSAGSLVINDIAVHLANPYVPFGGVGESGMGVYHGKFSFDAFTHKKPVVSRGFGLDPSIRYPPYIPRALRLIKALLSGNLMRIIRALVGC